MVHVIFLDDEWKKTLLIFDVYHNNHTMHNIILDPGDLGILVNLRSNIYYISGFDAYHETFHPLEQLINGSFIPIEKIPFVDVWMKIHQSLIYLDEDIDSTFDRLSPVPYYKRCYGKID